MLYSIWECPLCTKYNPYTPCESRLAEEETCKETGETLQHSEDDLRANRPQCKFFVSKRGPKKRSGKR